MGHRFKSETWKINQLEGMMIEMNVEARLRMMLLALPATAAASRSAASAAAFVASRSLRKAMSGHFRHL